MHGDLSHSHEHTHVCEDTAHSHDHLHKCSGEVGHNHKHAGQSDDDKETDALIKYMLAHNRHHADELNELRGKLNAGGRSEAARLIENAVSCVEKGKLELEKAVRLID